MYNICYNSIITNRKKEGLRKDVDNGWCYILVYSCCLRKDCDGKLVRKRISSVSYNQALLKLKEMIPK